MRTSYKEEDVIFLLKDITGLVKPQPTEEREKMIQAGKHYCEMLPIEYVPSERYMEAYRDALTYYADPVALAVGRLAGRILQARGRELVLVSLARAGTPIGILLKRYISVGYGLELPHYSISIIRGKGIDKNAMKYLLSHYRAENLLFVDGWIGKGAILGELKKAVSAYAGVNPELAVLADPAHMTRLYGTREDILIPSSCLNSTVSGLVSRTFLREDIIGETDYHGAIYYGEWEKEDLSYEFIEAIEKRFKWYTAEEELKEEMKEKMEEESPKVTQEAKIDEDTEGGIEIRPEKRKTVGLDEVKEIANAYQIGDIHFIKPGIGETTRVLLRRVPWKILVKTGCSADAELQHILRLAQEKNVPVEEYPLVHYKTCGLIKKLADA